jgi:hypothetical protein
MSNTAQTAAETAAAATAAKVAQTATYVGSASAVFFGLTANELAAIGGLVLGALGLVVNAVINVYFKHQHLKLARERMERETDDDQA